MQINPAVQLSAYPPGIPEAEAVQLMQVYATADRRHSKIKGTLFKEIEVESSGLWRKTVKWQPSYLFSPSNVPNQMKPRVS